MKSMLLIALAVCAQVAVGDETDEKKSSAQTQQAKKADAKNSEAKQAKLAEGEVKSSAPMKADADDANTADTANAAGAAEARATDAKTEAKELLLHEQPTMLAMLKRNNELRQSVGLSVQTINPALTRAANKHAAYMARTGAFDHYVNGNPRTRAHGEGYKGWASENIARGQVNVYGAFRAWRNSSGHWANIRSSNSEVGFGYAKSRGGMAYWVTLYGTPAKKKSDDDSSTTSTSTTNRTSNYYSSNTRSTRKKKTGPLRRFADKVFKRR